MVADNQKKVRVVSVVMNNWGSRSMGDRFDGIEEVVGSNPICSIFGNVTQSGRDRIAEN